MPHAARRALVIVNKSSGQAEADLSAGLESLQERGMELTVFHSVPPDEIPSLLEEHHENHDLVILGGGDGTMNAAAETLINYRLTLAILPLGTANDLARTLSIPLSLPAAFEVIAEGHLHTIDLGQVNGRPFFNVASVGLGVEVQRFHEGERKRRWKVLSYIFSVIDAFRKTKSFRATIECDGKTYSARAIHIAVGNGRHYGGGMTVAEDAAIDDDALDLYLLRPQSLAELVMLAPALRWGRLRISERTMTLRGRTITIETDKTKAINADGEVVGETPAEFSVLSKALRVVVPESYASPRRELGNHAA